MRVNVFNPYILSRADVTAHSVLVLLYIVFYYYLLEYNIYDIVLHIEVCAVIHCVVYKVMCCYTLY